MEKYDYRKAIKEDVLDAIEERTCLKRGSAELADLIEREGRDQFEMDLERELWMDDSVTGNASGSYTFNTWKAEENLAHNWELAEEAAEEFGMEANFSSNWKNGDEWWDVTIRCYLLTECIQAAVTELLEN